MKRHINESVLLAAKSLIKPWVTLNYHQHLLEMFNDAVAEQVGWNDDNTKVLDLIQAGKWDRNPKHFKASLDKSRHSKMLTQYSVEDLAKMDTYKVPGYDIGFALKDHDGSEDGGSGEKGRVEIVAVHNNSNVKGIGKDLMKAAIAAGGTVLDHFDGFLSEFYKGLGFEEYKRDEYNPDYDEGGEFAKKYGKQAVIYRKFKKPEVSNVQ